MAETPVRGNIVDVEAGEQTFAPEDYNHVAGGSKLIGLHMISSDFKIHPAFFSNRDDVKLSIANDIISSTPDAENDVCVTIFEFTVRGKHGRRDAFKCSAQFVAAYSLPEKSEPKAAEAFCSKVGLFATYPYFRGHFAQVASAANAELPPLPMMTLVPRRKTNVEQVAKAPTSTPLSPPLDEAK